MRQNITKLPIPLQQASTLKAYLQKQREREREKKTQKDRYMVRVTAICTAHTLGVGLHYSTWFRGSLTCLLMDDDKKYIANVPPPHF